MLVEIEVFHSASIFSLFDPSNICLLLYFFFPWVLIKAILLLKRKYFVSTSSLPCSTKFPPYIDKSVSPPDSHGEWIRTTSLSSWLRTILCSQMPGSSWAWGCFFLTSWYISFFLFFFLKTSQVSYMIHVALPRCLEPLATYSLAHIRYRDKLTLTELSKETCFFSFLCPCVISSEILSCSGRLY